MGVFGSSESDLQRRVEELERRVAALERAAFAAGRTPSPAGPTGISDTVRQLAWQGKKIEAIKVLREESGLGLREAKNIVEGLG